jgi:putative SbcD/Mre11-related phosphoesterase
MGRYSLRFVYEKAALVLHGQRKNYVLVGDIHIGFERKLYEKGLHLHGVTEHMAKQLKEIARANSAESIIMLGDIKDSLFYPDSTDSLLIREFFKELQGFDIEIAVGNHDAHLEEIVSVPIKNEIIIGDFAMMHGHMMPSEEAMRKKYLIMAHNHIAISFVDKNGAFYNQKAWLVAKLTKNAGLSRYPGANVGIKLVVSPAFNDLITGYPVNDLNDRHINPVFRNHVFDYANADVYTIYGELIGSPRSLRKKAPKR